MTRLEALNLMASALGARTYLEIGVQRGLVFRVVNVAHKVGVDPDPRSAASIHRTSNDYFADLDPATRFDLIFIDGLHLAEQVEQDVANALKHLTPGGVIMLHDCSPPTKRSAEREIDPALWCGDVWRAWVRIRAFMPSTFTVDTDLGLGVISPTDPIRPVPEPHVYATWEDLDQHRQTALGLVPVPEFRRWVRTLPRLAR